MKCIMTGQARPGSSGSGDSGIYLQRLDIISPPDKTIYWSSEAFNMAGMQILGIYGVDGNPFEDLKVDVTDNISVSPIFLTDGVEEVTFFMLGENGKEITAYQAVQVSPVVVELVSGGNIEYGNVIPNEVLAAITYSDGTEINDTAYIVDGGNIIQTLGNIELEIIYNNVQEAGLQTAHGVLYFHVYRKRVPKPIFNQPTLKYTGNIQSINNESYWENYNLDYWDISGYEGTNAGTYTAIIKLKEFYRWDQPANENDLEDLFFEWEIQKSDKYFEVETQSISISDSESQIIPLRLKQHKENTEDEWGVTTGVSGTWTLSPNSINGLTTLSIDNRGNLTVQSDGATPISNAEITVTFCKDPDNYMPCTGTITINASYWEWGDENGDADAEWFKGLRDALPSMSSAEKESLVGKTKSVALNSYINVFPQTHLIQCIGVDQDGKNTATFQTKSTSINAYVFGSNAQWIGSTMRTYCTQYYNAFPGKAYIKTVSKGTCAVQSDGRNATPTYNDETVFLPSEREMGLNEYGPLSVTNSTNTKAECTYGYNESYKYYINDSARIKKAADSITSARTYWERSRFYGTGRSTDACFVNGNGYAKYQIYSIACNWAPAFVIGSND